MEEMKIKVMHIAQAPGGVERYIQMLLKYMDDASFDNILVGSNDYHHENYQKLVSSFENVEMQRNINLKGDLYSIIEIRKLIKKYNPNVIYMHSSKAGAVGRLASFGFRKIKFYNPHGWAFNMDCGDKKKKLYRFIETILSFLCTKIIAISNFEKCSALANRVCKENKIRVIYNGVDIEDYNSRKSTFQIKRSQLGIPETAVVFGTVGRLSKQKAPDIFVKTARLIKNVIPDAYFVFVGSGEDEQKVKALVSELKLDECVKITGWVSEPMQYIEWFDVAFLLSRWEGFGLVLAEYMLAKKPIVATAVDAIPNVIRSEYNGVLVGVDSPEEACNAAIRIVSDRAFRERLINNGYTTVYERFDIKRVAVETQELIRGIINEKHLKEYR